MFIKSLEISTPINTIRKIDFHRGMNLIVDNKIDIKTETGNNVGKTTVLRLIDFCLGGDAKNIYKDPENKHTDYQLVKDYLIDNKVEITLTLTRDFEADDIIIRRNFLQRKNAIREINGDSIQNTEFKNALMHIFFPNLEIEKPSFRQIISHNIRYGEQRLTNTLKTLDVYTSDAEYEILYLFLFGCHFDEGAERQKLLENIKIENTFKTRLEKNQTKNIYESVLNVINNDIVRLNREKEQLNINPNFEEDLSLLNQIKYQLNVISTDLTTLSIRKNIIQETMHDINLQKSEIDIMQLKMIYQQANALIPNLQKKFEEFVAYHNEMLEQKARFIEKDIPKLEEKIKIKQEELTKFSLKEQELSKKLTKSSTFEDLENIISKLNELYRKKGEYESIITQITEVEKDIANYEEELNMMEKHLFSNSFETIVKHQLNKFNSIFSDISERMYGEKYIITHEISTNKQGQNMYKFTSLNANLSSGKKQGEIICFDIAYTIFADQNNIPCLHFLLNDKKELMHENQLLKISEIIEQNNIQFVASILKDKIPSEWHSKDYFILELSQNDKLFRIEKYS